jgi:hypothetical protein
MLSSGKFDVSLLDDFSCLGDEWLGFDHEGVFGFLFLVLLPSIATSVARSFNTRNFYLPTLHNSNTST